MPPATRGSRRPAWRSFFSETSKPPSRFFGQRGRRRPRARFISIFWTNDGHIGNLPDPTARSRNLHNCDYDLALVSHSFLFRAGVRRGRVPGPRHRQPKGSKMPRYILKHCSQSRAGKDASLSLGKRAIENRKQLGGSPHHEPAGSEWPKPKRKERARLGDRVSAPAVVTGINSLGGMSRRRVTLQRGHFRMAV